MAYLFSLLCLTGLLFPSFAPFSRSKTSLLYGVCEEVFDGDTLRVEGKVIRLAHIDAPERDQRSKWGVPVGRQSTGFLSSLVLGKTLRVELLRLGPYGRGVGRVWRKEDDLDVNLEMVIRGQAFVSFFREKPLGLFLSAQKEARSLGLGFWHYEGVIRPKSFRKKRKKIFPTDPPPSGVK